MIAALFVETNGVYFGLPDVDPWDEARDARKYDGPWPVVAHPPCGPWGIMRHLCSKQDPSCGPSAVASVRKWGGLLEHPAHSTLFRHCRMPLPGELPDEFGGHTFEVEQVHWGHPCSKPTWLYGVGLNWSRVALTRRWSGGKPTHRVTSGPRGPTLPSASAKVRRATPPAFAEWLIDLVGELPNAQEATPPTACAHD